MSYLLKLCLAGVLLTLAVCPSTQSEAKGDLVEKIEIVAESLKKSGWTIDFADLQQTGNRVSADYISIYSSDGNIALFMSEPSIGDFSDTGKTFLLADFNADNISLEISDMPVFYGSEDLTTMSVAIRQPVLSGITLQKITVPRFFTVAGRVPPGGADNSPSNQLRAFFDGLMIYVLQGGIEFADLSANTLRYAEGEGQNERVEKFEQIRATAQMAGTLEKFTAESWTSANDILPRRITRGRIELRDLNFQH